MASAAAPRLRSITITRRADPHARIEGTVDLVDAEILDVAISTMRSMPRAPGRDALPERRAHALVGLARYYLQHQADVPTGRLGRPHIVVLVDLETLEAGPVAQATMASGGAHHGRSGPPLG